MKSIKLYDGINVTLNDETEFFPDMKAYDFLRIPDELRINITRHLMAFRSMDLTAAYGGHYDKVYIELVPSK